MYYFELALYAKKIDQATGSRPSPPHARTNWQHAAEERVAKEYYSVTPFVFAVIAVFMILCVRN